MNASPLMYRRPIGCLILLLVTRSYSGFLGKWMVWFDIPDCPIFLIRGPSVLLVVNVSITAVSYVVASVAKTLSRSRPS
jgi:hypothetical protein